MYKEINECRFCLSKDLQSVLNLGSQPLANAFLASKDDESPEFPLEMYQCQSCKMLQLGVVVDPEILYSNYTYQSGMSNDFKKHCKALADEITFNFKALEKPFVISIAENDGTFLANFKNSHFKTLGVEPAKNLCEIATSNGIKMCNKFWGYNTALNIAHEYGCADVITAQNVFAHIDNVYEFMTSANMLLKDHGVLIIEVPWAGDTFEKADFSQTYHEHLSYITVTGMTEFVKKFGMKVSKITYFDLLHCGTIRFYIHKDHFETNVSNLWEINNAIYRESHIFDSSLFTVNVRKVTINLVNKLKEYKEICGVGASAKSTVLLNYLKQTLLMKQNITKIYDSTPTKINKFQPGTKIPIVDFNLIKDETNPILILAWNWSNLIKENILKINPKAVFIDPF